MHHVVAMLSMNAPYGCYAEYECTIYGCYAEYGCTIFNKIATQGAPQMAVDKEANSLSRVYSYYSKFNLRLFYV